VPITPSFFNKITHNNYDFEAKVYIYETKFNIITKTFYASTSILKRFLKEQIFSKALRTGFISFDISIL